MSAPLIEFIYIFDILLALSEYVILEWCLMWVGAEYYMLYIQHADFFFSGLL